MNLLAFSLPRLLTQNVLDLATALGIDKITSSG